MKHSKLILTLTAVALLSSACAKEFKSEDAAANEAAPIVVPTYPEGALPGEGVGTAGDSYAYGSTVKFVPDSVAVMSDYTKKNLYNPTNVQFNMNVIDVGGGHFGGQVKISYEDQGVRKEGYFVAGTGKNGSFPSNGNNQDVGLYQAQYNTWFNNGAYFSGYFQDSLGALVVVIDDVGASLGDGQGVTTVSGSVWYKNFPGSRYLQQLERYCWFITIGPYQCLTSTVKDNKQTPYPQDGYRRLGTFSGLSKAKAFNQ
ncbi:MAG: hypothetical protein EOP06_23930 [Proteobacteria bacterium]|nr:MAG: hypothetical protein EOP06_23930 [Pseudomonadota bacterium]